MSTVVARPLPGLHVDRPWKQFVFDFARDHLQHSAWGLAHSERDFLVATDLATREHVPIDEDVLFAAAMLHDMGGFPEFEKAGVDHADRSAQIVGDTVLRPAGFPSAKIAAVQQAIVTHSYYCPTPPTTPEGVVLHDADALDFLGAISAARMLSLTEREPAGSTLGDGVKSLQELLRDAPPSLVLPTSKAMGQVRAAELKDYLDRLNSESFDGQAL